MVSVSQLFSTLLNIQIHQVLRSNKSSKLNNVDFFQTDWTSRKKDAKRRLIMFRPQILVRTPAVNDQLCNNATPALADHAPSCAC